MTIDDKVYDRFLNTIRDGEADVGTIDIRIDGRWQTIDFRPALARLVAERDDAIAQMNDADSATDNATQIAERVVRELRQEYVDVINRLEKQSAAREEALHDAVEQARRLDELYEAACADIGDLQGKMDRLRAENERLREALADIREWSKRDDFIRFDDGDISLADYCARALHGGK
jgi:hypothetical protein